MLKTRLIAGALLLAQLAWGQSLPPIAQRVQSEKMTVGAFAPRAVFSTDTRDAQSRPDVAQALTSGRLLQLDAASLKALRSANPDRLEFSLPMPEGNSLQLELVRAKVFSPEFQVYLGSAPDVPAKVDLGQHYWGIVKDRPGTLAAISVFDHEIMGMVNTETERYVLGALANDADRTHVIYRERDLRMKNPNQCHADLLEKIDTDTPVGNRSAGPDNCVRQYMEADYTIFQNKGSVANATAYITGFYSQVSLLYANESVNVVLHHLLVWDVPDPYTGPSSSNYLTQFRNYLNGNYNGDLAHLVGFTGGGGIAYLDVLCNAYYGVAYSGINTTYSNVPTYSWTVEVVTHELGHNLGSPHTHACAWNGNNTAIDGCGPTAGYSEGCTAPLPTGGGTIMSYCHLVSGVGINFNNGFGPQPGDRIRSEVYNAACLTTCGGGGPCTYGPVNSQNFETGWGIWTDGGTDCARINNATYANSGTYSIQLRDNTGTSVMTTTNQNWTSYDEVTVEFSFITVSFDNSNEDFWLQISTNGGTSYTTVGDWNYSVQFTNGVRGSGSVVIPGPFTSTTRLRFRCDASADDDQVYIDDVVITGCAASFSPQGDPSENRTELLPGEGEPVFSGVQLSPNPANDRLDLRFNTSQDAPVQVLLLDLTGRVVFQQQFSTLAGNQNLRLDLSAAPAGVYALQLRAMDQLHSEKVVLRK